MHGTYIHVSFPIMCISILSSKTPASYQAPVYDCKIISCPALHGVTQLYVNKLSFMKVYMYVASNDDILMYT